MKRKKHRYLTGYLTLFILLIIVLLLNLNIGSVHYTLKETVQVLTGSSTNTKAIGVLWQIRLPRMMAALILGGALSVSGCMLQNFFGNPIAGPFVLGISSGAKLIVALTMILFLQHHRQPGSYILILAAFFGSLISMGFILVLSTRVNQMSFLVICGIMIGYICSAVTDFVVTFADDSNIVNLHNWSQGSFSSTGWSDVGAMAIVVGMAMLVSLFLLKPMNAYQLGELYARNMGVPIHRFRISLILVSSVLSACVVAFAGPISFVGIAVPHMIRRLFRTGKPSIVVTASFLGGALFCLFCDLLARSLFSPTELSISSVTAVFGAPTVIGLMLRRHKEKE